MRTEQKATLATDDTSAPRAPEAETMPIGHQSAVSDEPAFTRGITFRHILRAHEIIRRFGWKHLIAPH